MANGGVDVLQIDEAYEFRAPRFFDFVNEESEEDIKRAELWFETSRSYAPSPFMPRIREGRSVQIDSLCDFGNVDQQQKVEVSTKVTQTDALNEAENTTRNYQEELETKTLVKPEQSQEVEDRKNSFEFVCEVKPQTNILPQQKTRSSLASSKEEVPSSEFHVAPGGAPVAAASSACTAKAQKSSTKMVAPSTVNNHVTVEACTPRAQRIPEKGVAPSSSKHLTTRKNASMMRQPSALKPKTKSPIQSSKSTKGKNIIKRPGSLAAKSSMATEIAQENQAVKRQKLDDGRSRQIHNIKNRVLLHKPRLGLTGGTDMSTSAAKGCLEEKSSRKIFEAPSFPALPKSVPQPPIFQEFHLKTMDRANQHAETSSSNQNKPFRLTEPRPPHLETSLRARPPTIKSTQELELEELEKIPKFKARPLNKKILESKGEIGLFCNPKPQITITEEFCFATNERLGPPAAVVQLFDKAGIRLLLDSISRRRNLLIIAFQNFQLSLHSETSNHERKEVPRVTIPTPFHLHTEERGFEKERQLAEQILQKELEEERARIPKANPYPYTTDYPVIPPKPEAKHCTKPEAFQLESLVRHEEEMQRKLEEKERMEREEAQRRIFRAQPILNDDPLPLPQRERKPLTEIKEFVLHVDHRAVERTEFDQKIKEKELTYKRLREEQEFAQLMEEEKAVKQMRRTMVPHSRPLPKFNNPFVPQKSTKEATKPKSPDLRVNHRVERRQAFHMR
ncbi:Cell cycle regulated microtubule associated protein [Musa troglodytarum]|uniref:Cell cycle regulated microtubule associated protein n=1 Tax=Musa troglodytarum TaxID=320322 RepID=A0A9E7H7U6_9LILI|nr:Cell cycle regulated microtubule associated protein [Musa troglodytarum]